MAVDDSVYQMEILGNFFTIDVGDTIKYWITNLYEFDDPYFGAGGDWASLEKDDEGYVIMTDVVTERDYEPEPVPLEYSLRIKPAELIKLLYKWEELYAKKVPEIMITKNGDSFEMFEVKP